MAKSNKKEFRKEREELAAALRARFEKNTNRCIGLEWGRV
jgi:hypothetical protein